MKESVLGNANQRKQQDLKFFEIFCKLGLKSKHPPSILEAIRMGKSNTATEPVNRPHPSKLVFENKDEKISIFRLLRNLKTADEMISFIRVSHDCSQATRTRIKVMIEEAKFSDGRKIRKLYLHDSWPRESSKIP